MRYCPRLRTIQTIFADFFALPQRFGLDNYISAEKMVHILRATANSLLLSAGSICLMLGVSIMGAYVTARKRIPGSEGVTLFLIAAMMIPIQSAIVPIVQMVSAIGQRNNLFVLMIIYAGINLSMVFFILKGYIEGIPKELDEAAMIDGCGTLRTYFMIVFPILKPTAITVAILNTMWIWNDYLLPTLILGSDPNIRTLPMAIQYLRGGYGAIDMGAMMAMIVLAIIPVVIFYLTCQKYIIKGVVAGAVKG